jgi:hypothetical protein
MKNKKEKEKKEERETVSEDGLMPQQTSPRALTARRLFTYLPQDFDLYPLTLFHNNHPPCSQHPPHQTRTRNTTAHRMTPTQSANMADPTGTHEEWWRMERKQHMMEREQRRMEREQKEWKQKTPKKSGGSDSLRESEAASLATGAADVDDSREIVPATANSTPATEIEIGSVATVAHQNTSSTPSSNNRLRVPTATATQKLEKGREAREKTLKERKETDPASPPYPPHQTTAHGSATSPADLDDPVVFQARTLEKKKVNDRSFEFAVTRLRPTETVVATVDRKKTVPAIAKSTPEIQSKVRSVTTVSDPDEKELIDEIQASFTTLEIASVLGSSFNVLGWQPPKKRSPDVATVDSNRRSLLNSGMPTASDFAFQAKPMPELKVAAIPSSFNICPPDGSFQPS